MNHPTADCRRLYQAFQDKITFGQLQVNKSPQAMVNTDLMLDHQRHQAHMIIHHPGLVLMEDYDDGGIFNKGLVTQLRDSSHMTPFFWTLAYPVEIRHQASIAQTTV